MDTTEKIEVLQQNSFAFEVSLTLDEIEWTRILGPTGLGNTLLSQMVELGRDFFELSDPDYVQNGRGDILSFRIGGTFCELRLDYEQPFTANLQSAVREVLDGVNRALRHQSVPFRFVCVRDSCTGAGCSYRLMLLPTAWIRDVSDSLNIVAGLRLEDYELQPPFRRPELGGGFLEAR